MKNSLLCFSLIMVTSSAFAAPHFIAIVDAGSSHTALEIYSVEKNKSQTVNVQHISHDQIDVGISSFADHTQELTENMKPLLHHAALAVPAGTPLYLYGTAGMRLLSEPQQREIYDAIKQCISQETYLSPKEIKTITGQMEGVYDFIAANDAKHNIDIHITHSTKESRQYYGILDMGGASVEVVYPCNPSNSADNVSIPLHGTTVSLCAHSFLGWGQQEALNASHYPESCFANNYTIEPDKKGHFDLKQCQEAIKKNVLTKNLVNQASGKISNSISSYQYLALSGFYNTSEFLNLRSPQNFDLIDELINPACEIDWEIMKKRHPGVPEKYLKNYCFNAVYHSMLAKNVFHDIFHKSNVVGGEGINWTAGAAYLITAQE